MSDSGRKLQNTWTAVALIAVGLAGCANSCFVFVSSNGSSGVFVKVGEPPPVCSLGAAQGAIRATVLKSRVCEACTPSTKMEHVFVTVRGIQLSPTTIDANPPEWFEIAPHLAVEPKQIDLMGNAAPEILVDRAMVSALSYREVRLQFMLAPDLQVLPAQNACGEGQWNCVVMADGRAEPLRLPRDVPELVMPLSIGNEAVAVLPDGRMDLQLSLESHRVLTFSSADGLKPQIVLSGRAHAVREWHFESQGP
jgi:hypothetical protein